jgi:hypothetical protein
MNIPGFLNAAIAASQSCNGGFDNVLADSTVEFGPCPFHFDIHNTVQHVVNLFHHYR